MRQQNIDRFEKHLEYAMSEMKWRQALAIQG